MSIFYKMYLHMKTSLSGVEWQHHPVSELIQVVAQLPGDLSD